MSFLKRDWSDAEKWAMGIVATLLGGALLAVFSNIFLSQPDRSNNPLASEAVTIKFSTETTNEGEVSSVSGPEQKMQGRPLQINDSPEDIEMPKGELVQVCGEYWISAVPKYDSSTGSFPSITITLPDGSKIDHGLFAPAPIEIAPGCIVVGGRTRENRPGDPDSILSVIQENL